MAMKKKKQSSASKWAEDWVPIKNIMNGMIELETGEYVTGVKIVPRNIFIMDSGSRDNAIYQLRNFYNTINYEFWLVIADRPVDINMYLASLQMLYNNSTDANIKKMIRQDIDKANMFMSTYYNVVDTEFYIIFKDKKLEVIQRRLQQMISNLANAGLQSHQTSNDDLRIVIDNFFNGGASTPFTGMVSVE